MSVTLNPAATALPIVAPPAMSAEALDYASSSSAENTRRAYRAAWSDFTAWCEEAGVPPLPASPETVGSYLAARAGIVKASTLALRLVAIRQAHRLSGHRLDTGHPAIRETAKGIRRTHGTAPAKKEAATTTHLRDAVDRLAQVPGLRALRDRALLLVGFAAALRRSELVALDVRDLRFAPEGVVLTLRRSKTDGEGVGAEIAIPFGTADRTCPVQTVQAWLRAAAIAEGPVFVSVTRHGRATWTRLSDRDVARAVKAAVGAAGYAPEDWPMTAATRENLAALGFAPAAPCHRARSLWWVDTIFCDATPVGTRPLAAADLAPGEEVDFSRHGSGWIYLLDGWFNASPEGAWTRGHVSALVLRPKSIEGPPVLEMEAARQDGPAAAEVVVRAEGREVVRRAPPRAGMERWTACLPAGVARVTFEAGDAAPGLVLRTARLRQAHADECRE